MALFKATVPTHVEAVVELFDKAPTFETPFPFMVNPSVAVEVKE